MAFNKPDEPKKECPVHLVKAQHQFLRTLQHAHYGTSEFIPAMPPGSTERVKPDVNRILADSGYKFDRVEDHWLFDGLVRVMNDDVRLAVPPVFDCDDEGAW